jgi:hypothetical protein
MCIIICIFYLIFLIIRYCGVEVHI